METLAVVSGIASDDPFVLRKLTGKKMPIVEHAKNTV
jgi:hypothetical protein